MNGMLDKLKELEAKYLYMILTGIIIVIVVFDIFTLMRFQLKLVNSLNAKSSQLSKDIIDLTTNKQRLAQFKSQLEIARHRRESFDLMVHRKDKVPMVLKKISSIANEQGVNVIQLMPQKLSAAPLIKNEDGAYYSMDISVRLRAGYHQFGKFLNRMEQDRLFWQIDELSLEADQKDPQRQDIKMNMKILILEK